MYSDCSSIDRVILLTAAILYVSLCGARHRLPTATASGFCKLTDQIVKQNQLCIFQLNPPKGSIVTSAAGCLEGDWYADGAEGNETLWRYQYLSSEIMGTVTNL